MMQRDYDNILVGRPPTLVERILPTPHASTARNRSPDNGESQQDDTTRINQGRPHFHAHPAFTERDLVKKPLRSILAGLALAGAALTGALITTDTAPATPDDTAWGAPDTTTPADTGWGTPPTDTPNSDTGWG